MSRVEIDSNIFEHYICPIALNRKNEQFSGSDGGSEHSVIIDPLVDLQLSGTDPQAYLCQTLPKIGSGYLNSQLDNLMPRSFRAKVGLIQVA